MILPRQNGVGSRLSPLSLFRFPALGEGTQFCYLTGWNRFERESGKSRVSEAHAARDK